MILKTIKERINRFEVILFGIFFLILIYIRMRSKYLNTIQPDCRMYYAMGSNIFILFNSAIMKPFCYRVLVPFIVYILPFETDLSFLILSFIGAYFTGIMLYYTLRIKFNSILSTYGLLAYITIDCVEIVFEHYYLVDSIAFLFIILCFYAILKKNNILYAISLILGTLTKEVVLFTIPVFVVYSIYFVDDDLVHIELNKDIVFRIIKLSKYFAPSLLIYILLLIIIKPYPHGIYDDISLLFAQTADYHLNRIIKKPYTLANFILAWEFIPFFFCLFNKKKEVYKWLKIYGVFMFLVYFQLAIAHSPTDRLLLVGYFPMIFLSVSGLNQLSYKIGIQKNNIINTQETN